MVKKWRNSKLYKVWRKIVIHFKPYCDICGEEEHLHAHHLNDASNFPLQRYNPNNGKTLCRRCHRKFHIYYMQGYRNKCTKKDYIYFKKLLKPKEK